METSSPGGELAAALERDLQLAAEANPRAVSSDLAEKSDPVGGVKNNY